jgi:hypothetical protein
LTAGQVYVQLQSCFGMTSAGYMMIRYDLLQ